MSPPTLNPVYWTDVDPRRLARDLADVSAFAPDLDFQAPPGVDPRTEHHGVWTGVLPVWPFDRPKPAGLDELVPTGFRVQVECSAAHPVIPPAVFPLDPLPEIAERSQHIWHVAPDGRLCLMQTIGAWRPSDTVSDLLAKACAWRVEYALMKRGALSAMTLDGIVSGNELDDLVARTAAAIASRGTHADEDA
ncbi:hypothetical protein [Cellulomonas sp. P24]|uniref:hypothetical protein n=1 Tax=Cellulomonas sp. P24 TaxID=2885206 RepID=UPI00216B1A8A|nr:hypothetical protein [Cellulomonas sp. P24]MCR6491129.1 hypothetical protein [Cellulomonas sp. P24]